MIVSSAISRKTLYRSCVKPILMRHCFLLKAHNMKSCSKQTSTAIKRSMRSSALWMTLLRRQTKNAIRVVGDHFTAMIKEEMSLKRFTLFSSLFWRTLLASVSPTSHVKRGKQAALSSPHSEQYDLVSLLYSVCNQPVPLYPNRLRGLHEHIATLQRDH